MERNENPDHEEIAAVARELWRVRGGASGSSQDDWYRAEQILRNRHRGNPERGNSTLPVESYLQGTAGFGTPTKNEHREKSEHMDTNTMTGTTGTGSGNWQQNNERTGQQSGSGMMDSIRQSVSGVVDQARNSLQTEPMSMPRPEHREGPVARAIEQQTARIPSDAFLWAAVGSIGLSLALELSGKEKTANFVGHWAPTLLILGLYNKMVKLQGSDGI